MGRSASVVGDVNQDDIVDLVAGAYYDGAGAVYLFFLETSGHVKSHQKISSSSGSFTGSLTSNARFGISTTGLHDLNEDGTHAIAVGADYMNAVFVIFVNDLGQCVSHQKFITEGSGNFGVSMDNVADINADGTVDLLVGAYAAESWQGIAYVCFLQNSGLLLSYQIISTSQGSFTGVLNPDDRFSAGISRLGDLDQDTFPDCMIGAFFDDDGGYNTGAVYVVFLDALGHIRSHQKISKTSGGLTVALSDSASFGIDIAELGEVLCEGVRAVAVGAHKFDTDGVQTGAVFIIHLDAFGIVQFQQQINTDFGFTASLEVDRFGIAVESLGDLDNSGSVDLLVAALEDDEGGSNTGSLYVLFGSIMSSVCSEPERQRGYVIEGNSFTTRTARCATGYQGSSVESITCLPNGQWTRATGKNET